MRGYTPEHAGSKRRVLRYLLFRERLENVEKRKVMDSKGELNYTISTGQRRDYGSVCI